MHFVLQAACPREVRAFEKGDVKKRGPIPGDALNLKPEDSNPLLEASHEVKAIADVGVQSDRNVITISEVRLDSEL